MIKIAIHMSEYEAVIRLHPGYHTLLADCQVFTAWYYFGLPVCIMIVQQMSRIYIELKAF
jgi:hypothetical protein